MFRTALFAAAALALSACTSTEGATQSADAMPGNRDCFRSDAVSGFNVVDNNNIRVTVGANRHYILSTTWNVSDLDWSNAMALRSPTGWICVGSTPGVEVIGGRPARNFPIQTVSRAPDPPGQEGS
jgi:hypothetical protein